MQMTYRTYKSVRTPKVKNPHLYDVGVRAPTSPLTTVTIIMNIVRKRSDNGRPVTKNNERRIRGALMNH